MDWLSHLTDAPFANVLFLAGLGFLAVGVFGKIIGKIEPDRVGRITSAVVGVTLLCVGYYLHNKGDREKTLSSEGANSQNSRATDSNNRGSKPVDPKLPYGRDTCKSGFVWRDAVAGDHVCVSSATRNAVAQQNQEAGAHRSPHGGPSGPDTCIVGFVWRDAFPGDRVCVTPAVRQQAANDNAEGPSRRVSP